MTAQRNILMNLFFFFMLFMIALGFSPAQANEPDYTEEDHLLVSVGGLYNSGVYEGMDGFIEADANIFARYGDWFARGQTFGYEWVKGERASLSFVLRRGDHQLEVSRTNDEQELLYRGIQDRDRAIEAGLLYRYNSRVGIVTLDYFKDVSDAHDAHRMTIRVARPIPNPGGISVVPSMYINYYNTNYNRYYYGVSRADNDAAILETYGVVNDTTRENYEAVRREYAPGNSGHFGVDVDIRMPLSDNLIITGYFSYEDITGEWYRSPLVEDRKLFVTKLGLGYSF